LKKILTSSNKEISGLTSEYEIIRSFSNTKLNLVKIYGMETKQLDKTTHVMYVLMDLALRDWEKEINIRRSKNMFYTENELLQILKQLVITFAELQRRNISHRDIKPQNILLFPDNTFRISDFGEAKEILSSNKNDKNNTIKQTIRGTELYMSPILFKALKEKGIDEKYTEHNSYKSDVFSLGLCLLLGATLTFNALIDIRELEDMINMKMKLAKYLKGRYTSKFLDILYSMLEMNEKMRHDFIELEKYVERL
jgi:serine/threonine protein kinase